jgi:phosphomannomutase
VAVDGRFLRGDELGALLGDHVLRHRPGPVATTIVSSTLLDAVAAAHGVRCTRTLTGFKWIMRADPALAFGYEEALGYAVGPQVVRDKDGLSAALLVAELAAGLRAEGRTLLDRLDDLEREHGVHATAQHAVRVADPGLIAAAMARLRAAPPAALAGRRVEEVEDLLDPADGGLPPADVVVLRLAGARVVVRPSGTEPKLKAYLEVTAGVAGDLGAARRRARDELAGLRSSVAELLGL